MWPLMIIEVRVGGQASHQYRHRGIILEVDVLVFAAMPSALAYGLRANDADVVQGSAPTIHTDADGRLTQRRMR